MQWPTYLLSKMPEKKHEYLKLFQVYNPPEYCQCQSSRDKGGAYNKQIGTENSEI